MRWAWVCVFLCCPAAVWAQQETNFRVEQRPAGVSGGVDALADYVAQQLTDLRDSTDAALVAQGQQVVWHQETVVLHLHIGADSELDSVAYGEPMPLPVKKRLHRSFHEPAIRWRAAQQGELSRPGIITLPVAVPVPKVARP